MRTSLLIIVPCILLAGLLFGAFKLKSLRSSDTPCVQGSCPLSLHEGDSEKTFFYAVATRFKVSLNENRSPEENLRCIPEGVIMRVADATPSAPPMYTAAFEGVAEGTCTLRGDNFYATIVIQ